MEWSDAVVEWRFMGGGVLWSSGGVVVEGYWNTGGCTFLVS